MIDAILHHFTWLMQYCIILNHLSSMWTHRCTPGVLVILPVWNIPPLKRRLIRIKELILLLVRNRHLQLLLLLLHLHHLLMLLMLLHLLLLYWWSALADDAADALLLRLDGRSRRWSQLNSTPNLFLEMKKKSILVKNDELAFAYRIRIRSPIGRRCILTVSLYQCVYRNRWTDRQMLNGTFKRASQNK